MTVSAIDYTAIADHLAHYCWNVDEGDEAAWVALWTEDGVFAGEVEIQGRAQLANIVKLVQRRGPGKTRHSVTNLYCDYGDNKDTVHVGYYNLMTSWVEKAALVGLILTKGVLVRSGDGWLIKRLDLKMLSGT